MTQGTQLNVFGGTINLGIKEAKRRGLKGKDLQAFKTQAWTDHREKNDKMAKELEKAKRRLARKQKK